LIWKYLEKDWEWFKFKGDWKWNVDEAALGIYFWKMK
jgi:hypothetical protein